MVLQAQLILLLFYYRLHVSTYIQATFRPFDRRVRKCYECWDPIMFIDALLVPYGTSKALRNFYYSDQHEHFMYLSILSLWIWWDPNIHSIYGLSYQKAWRWPVCRSKHVACNKTSIKSVVPDVPLFYFISKIMWTGHTRSCKYWNCRRGIADKVLLLEDATVSEEKQIFTVSKPQGCLKTGGIGLPNEEALYSGRTEFRRVILKFTSKDPRNCICFLSMFSTFFNKYISVSCNGFEYGRTPT